MLIERSELLIKDGLEEEFAAVMAEKGAPLLKRVTGIKTVSVGRGVENPGKFMLLIEWETMAAHTAFRDHPLYPDFRALLSPFTKGGAMEHFVMS